jgi:hypothetical protein
MEEQERRFILNRERRALLDEVVSHVEESGKDFSNEADESLQGAVYADLDHQHHHRYRHRLVLLVISYHLISFRPP